MRRLVPLICAAAVLLGVPAEASAGGFVIDFSEPPFGEVHVYGFNECAQPSCTSVPVALSVERNGIVVGTSAPAREARVKVDLLPGDIVRIFRDGVERAAVPYEATPTTDDESCAIVGSTSITGRLRLGDPAADPFSGAPPPFGAYADPWTEIVVLRGGVVTETTVTADGDRWRAEFQRPLERGENISVYNMYRIVTPVGTATVWASSGLLLCPVRWQPPPPPIIDLPLPPAPPPTPAPACTADAIAADPAFETRLTRAVQRVRLRALRKGVARLTGLPACAGGAVTVEVKAGGAVVARGTATATGAQITQALTRTRRAARLAGRRRARVKVTIRIADGAGGAVTWSCRVTLR